MAEQPDKITAQLALISKQTDLLLQALKVITGCELHDTNGLIEFREQHRRMLKMEMRFTALGHRLGEWVLRLLMAVAVTLMAFTADMVGAGSIFKSLLGSWKG